MSNIFPASSSMSKQGISIANFSPFSIEHLFLGCVISSTYFFWGVCFPSTMKAFINVLWEAAESTDESGCLVSTQVITIQRVLSYSSKAELLVLTGPQRFSFQLERPAMAGQKAVLQGTLPEVLQIFMQETEIQ